MTPAFDRREIVTSGVTLGLVVGVFAFTFGVGSVAAGASVAQTCLMSLLVFTGASQFSAVSVIGAGGTTGAALAGAMLLAARNGVYALAVARIIRGSLATRLLAAHWTIDETTAMATAQPDPAAKRTAFWATGIAVYTCWNVGTLIGALTGSAIDPLTFGLDAAFPAGFVAMVTPQLRQPPGLLAGILGAVICLVLIPFTPIGLPILCSAAAVLVGIPARTMQVESVPGTAGVP